MKQTKKTTFNAQQVLILSPTEYSELNLSGFIPRPNERDSSFNLKRLRALEKGTQLLKINNLSRIEKV